MWRNRSQGAIFDFYMLNRSTLSVPLNRGLFETTDHPEQIYGYFHLCTPLLHSFEKLHDLLFVKRADSRALLNDYEKTSWVADSWRAASGDLTTVIHDDFKRKYVDRGERIKSTRSKASEATLSTTVHEVKVLVNEIRRESNAAQQTLIDWMDHNPKQARTDPHIKKQRVHLRDLSAMSSILSAVSQVKSSIDLGASQYKELSTPERERRTSILLGALCIQILWHERFYRQDFVVRFVNSHKFGQAILDLCDHVGMPKPYVGRLVQIIQENDEQNPDTEDLISRIMKESTRENVAGLVAAFSYEIFANWKHFKNELPLPKREGSSREIFVSLVPRQFEAGMHTYDLNVQHLVRDKRHGNILLDDISNSFNKVNAKYGRQSGVALAQVSLLNGKIIESKNGVEVRYTLCFLISMGAIS